MEKISKIKSWLFKKINKFAKPRARLIKEKKKILAGQTYMDGIM